MCGRTARTVRRAGTAKAVPDPYRVEERTLWREIPPFSCSVDGRKLMAHFVVKTILSSLTTPFVVELFLTSTR